MDSFLRKSLVALLASGIALQPLAAQERFYFRNVQGSGSGSGTGSTPTNPGANPASISVGGSHTVQANQFLSIVPTAANIPAPVTWQVSPGLRTGLILNPTTGEITGASSITGQSNHTLSATNGAQTASASISIDVTPAPGATPPIVASYPSSFTFVAGEPISIPGPTITDGLAPFGYTITPTNVPFGFSASTGAITWASPVAGSYPNITVGVVDANSLGATSNPFSITVNPALSAGSYPTGLELIAGAQVSIPSPGASGGIAPVTFSLSSGSLKGLNLGNDGTISGSANETGLLSAGIVARDVNNRSVAVPFEATVYSALATPAGSFPETLPLGVAITPVSIIPNGGKGPYTYEIIGTPPSGLNFSQGVFTGVPDVAGSSSFFVTIHDSFSPPQTTVVNLSTEVTQPPLTVAASASPPTTATVGTPIQAITLSSTGGTGTVTYTATGQVPQGLGVSGNVFAGTPQVADTYTFAFRVTDSSTTPRQESTQSYTMTVNPPPQLVVTLATAPTPVPVNQPISSFQVTATGGVAPYAFEKGPNFPPGLNLSATGLVSGSPTMTGNYNFTVIVTDSTPVTPQVVPTNALTMVVTQAYGLSYTLDNPIRVNQTSRYTASTVGGIGPYTYALKTGAFPTGMTLQANGDVFGQPTVSGNGSFSVEVTDTGKGNAKITSDVVSWSSTTIDDSVTWAKVSGVTNGAANGQSATANKNNLSDNNFNTYNYTSPNGGGRFATASTSVTGSPTTTIQFSENVALNGMIFRARYTVGTTAGPNPGILRLALRDASAVTIQTIDVPITGNNTSTFAFINANFSIAGVRSILVSTPTASTDITFSEIEWLP